MRKPGEDDEKRVSPGKTGRVGKYEREGCGRRSLSTKINKKKKLSYSLSDLHCFFIVMSEEVIGLVRLHCFSPINTKVKHCKGREPREIHAKDVKSILVRALLKL